ncbi:MAG: aldo/keto reductase, partial [Maritimibacter sp.]
TKVGLLAYSPLAAGILTGKYQDGVFPAGSRGALDNALGGRNSLSHWRDAVDAYLEIAKKHDLLPEHLALRFCLSRYFMTSVIIGATSMEQLKNAISAADAPLSQEAFDEIEAVHRQYPLPY